MYKRLCRLKLEELIQILKKNKEKKEKKKVYIHIENSLKRRRKV